MKKIVSITLVLIMLVAGTATVLAEENGGNEKLECISDGKHARTIEDLFDEYNPSQKQTYLDIKAEHATFHESREGIRLEAIQSYAAQMAVIAGQVADGTITPAEGKEKLQELTSEIKAFVEEAKTTIEQKRAEAQSIKDELAALRTAIKDTLKQEEVVASQVAAYLKDLNTLLKKHLDMDYHYAELVDEMRPN